MNKKDAKEIADKIVGQVFGCQNPFTLEQLMSKFAFDIKLPQPVTDSTTNEETWAMSTSPLRFIKFSNALKRDDWMIPKKQVNDLTDIIEAWKETNLMAAERTKESDRVLESDNIRGCDGVFRSQDCGESKNIIYCDGMSSSEFTMASQRSTMCSFGIRIEDSRECSSSFNVSWSGKIADSFFIQDCFDLTDCIFCSHLTSKQYCIANMQFEKDEYMKLRDEIIKWILTS